MNKAKNLSPIINMLRVNHTAKKKKAYDEVFDEEKFLK